MWHIRFGPTHVPPRPPFASQSRRWKTIPFFSRLLILQGPAVLTASFRQYFSLIRRQSPSSHEPRFLRIAIRQVPGKDLRSPGTWKLKPRLHSILRHPQLSYSAVMIVHLSQHCNMIVIADGVDIRFCAILLSRLTLESTFDSVQYIGCACFVI